jgi:hypothetical protein
MEDICDYTELEAFSYKISDEALEMAATSFEKADNINFGTVRH